ncbi:MAG TPA: tRNA (adenosine(37)-N6)-dimethylallyltransferase MiaA [Bacteroidales bacterium]|nr:tRNA (adenosine(37)-N6)-dimethylallyltransferase MiaA [Bacteroidales bacterium]
MDPEISKEYDLVIVTGPTASGKTSLAVSLAHSLKGEIVSADSRQVYRGMDIGTGKDYNDYIIDGKTIPYHLIDIADPGYKYNVFEYQRDFFKVYKLLKERNVFPVVCGGSGMYADSIITGYKMVEVPPDTGLRRRLEKKSMEELTGILSAMKNLHNTTDIDNKKRVIRAIEIEHYNKNRKAHISDIPRINSLVIGVNLHRDLRRRNITRRLHQRLEAGLVEEVKRLISSGVHADMLIYYGLEYKYITHYLMGKLSYDKMVTDLEIAIHQFAKRQMTWFRGMEKKGTKIHWIDGELQMDEKVGMVINLLTHDKIIAE